MIYHIKSMAVFLWCAVGFVLWAVLTFALIQEPMVYFKLSAAHGVFSLLAVVSIPVLAGVLIRLLKENK